MMLRQTFYGSFAYAYAFADRYTLALSKDMWLLLAKSVHSSNSDCAHHRQALRRGASGQNGQTVTCWSNLEFDILKFFTLVFKFANFSGKKFSQKMKGVSLSSIRNIIGVGAKISIFQMQLSQLSCCSVRQCSKPLCLHALWAALVMGTFTSAQILNSYSMYCTLFVLFNSLRTTRLARTICCISVVSCSVTLTECIVGCLCFC